jgi:hypothetical protein
LAQWSSGEYLLESILIATSVQCPTDRFAPSITREPPVCTYRRV